MTILAHSGYEDGECVAIERRGGGGVGGGRCGPACAILGVRSLISRLQDNDRSLSSLTRVRI